eukprot:Hpha_TRINITY_DN12797_c0_g1::TRINITY_DN12797_c0_g1_i1::g.114239::m.114239
MAAIEPKSAFDPEAPNLTSPVDGHEYVGIPPKPAAGLQELWAGPSDPERKKQLVDWEKRVRLCIKLGQAACPDPPLDRKAQAKRMEQQGPVAQQTGKAGWAQGDRPVGQRGAYSGAAATNFGGWGARAGAIDKPKPADNYIPGAEPAVVFKAAKKKPEKKKPEEKKPEDKKPADAEKKPEAAKPPAGDAPAQPAAEGGEGGEDFSKREYADVEKRLKLLGKKQAKLFIARKAGKEGAEEELKAVQAEFKYLGDLKAKGVNSQEAS